MFRLLGISLAIITMGLCQPALAAEENWFEVEVYLFSRQATGTEQWPEEAKAVDTRKAIDLITPAITTDVSSLNSALNGCTASDWATRPDWCNEQLQVESSHHPDTVPDTVSAEQETYAKPGEGAVLLADSQSQFKEVIAKLSREPGVTGLLHMTWQENMLPRHQAKPIRIYAGKDFGKEYRADGAKIEANNDLITHFSYLNDFIEPDNQDPVWQLDGDINIYLNHWLYIETDLVLREEGEKTQQKPAEDNAAQSLTAQPSSEAQTTASQVAHLYAIEMKQNRRVRSDEMHYFDHPKLGLLIQIRKMEQPAERAAELAETEKSVNTL